MQSSLRLSLRFLIPLILVLGGFAYALVPLIDMVTLRWFVRDLDIRSKLIASTLQEPLGESVRQRARGRVNALFSRAMQDERLYALGFCDRNGVLIYRTSIYPQQTGCKLDQAGVDASNSVLRLPQGPLHVVSSTIESDGVRLGALILVHDMSFIERRSAETKKYAIGFFSLVSVIVAFITVLIAHISWRGWIAGARALLRGEGLVRPFDHPNRAELGPLVSDLRAFVADFEAERRARDDGMSGWTPESLRAILRDELSGDDVIVVSNREPYIHVRSAGQLRTQFPASGVVTAIEPVMRACSGTWIAHGGGNADRETVDRHDRVAVPPENPAYRLRRIWLTKEEEEGYYYGFANEGIWPLCHIAHVQPIFRSSDWEQYQVVNRRFADAVVAEARSNDPVIMVQDYHLALAPRLIRARLPRATVITFWHIPWPNPESFGICPWRDQLIDGLLGSTILGFHTRFHCNNFLATVDRYLEARIDYESSAISYGGELTQVRPYPISIRWPDEPRNASAVAVATARIRDANSVPRDALVGLGVDRLDYTKGIVERLHAIERLLERHAEWHKRFTFIQIAPPSRSNLPEYRNLEVRVREIAARINGRFSVGDWKPVVLKIEHHEPDIVGEYYRAANVCIVSSLHDGMNLVAKEFVAARDDEAGTLVLSQFTGAARELPEAVLVNPYHIEQFADALHRALLMPLDEQRERMRSMRRVVSAFNVYRWAGRMLLDAARIRQRERLLGRIVSHGSQVRRLRA